MSLLCFVHKRYQHWRKMRLLVVREAFSDRAVQVDGQRRHSLLEQRHEYKGQEVSKCKA